MKKHLMALLLMGCLLFGCATAIEEKSQEPTSSSQLIRLEKQVTSLRETHPNSKELVEALIQLAGTSAVGGNTAKVEALLNEALQILRHVSPQNRKRELEILSVLAMEQTNKAAYSRAEETWLQAVNLIESYPDEFSAKNKAAVYQGLGKFFTGEERYEEAKQCLDQALVFAYKVPKSERMVLAEVYNALGELVLHQVGNQPSKTPKDYNPAIRHFGKAFKVLDELNAMESLTAISMLNNFGRAYLFREEPEKAINSFLNALKLCERYFPPDHLAYGEIYDNLGRAFHSIGELDRAGQCFEKALLIYEQQLKPNDLRLVNIYQHYGDLYKALGSPKEAQRMYDQARKVEQMNP